MDNTFPIEWTRNNFPAVVAAEKEKPPFAFMDNAGGSQVPSAALDNVQRFFLERNVNLGGPYRHSIANTGFMDHMRAELAAFLGAASAAEIIFGPNATTLMRLLATSLRELIEPGDEIIISTLEHEANVTPWLRMQLDGAIVRFWEPRGPQAMLQIGDLRALLSDRTRIVALGGASNLLGNVHDLAEVAKLVHERGAILFVDGVHYAPHRRPHVSRDGIDIFVCSGYKVFGAHNGFAACSAHLLNELPSLNHYFLKDKLKFELGTQNFEGLAATEGVLQYFRELAAKLGITSDDPFDALYEHIEAYERLLSVHLIGGLQKIDGVHVYGITDPSLFDRRTPTAAFTVEDRRPDEVAAALGKAGLGVNYGDLYAARIVDWLGLRGGGGVIRASLCHYNTIDEIERLLDALEKI